MPTDDPAHPEARRSRRLPPRGSTQLEVYRAADGTGPDIAVRVLDISATGARLVLAERLPPGHLLGVALYGPRGLPIAGVASVVWAEEARDGTFITGVQFRRAAGDDHLDALASP